MKVSVPAANRLYVLKVIRRFGPISRTELVHLVGLTASTVTEVTRELLENNFISEERSSAGAKGRPRVALLVNPDVGYAIGVSCNLTSVVVETLNLRAEPIHSWSEQLQTCRSVADLAARFTTAIDHALQDSGIRKGSVLGVAATIPGVVDAVHGTVLWIPTFNEGPAPLAAEMEQRLGLPVVLDTRGAALARAEHWFGNNALADDFLLLSVGHALESARYQAGTMAIGYHGALPELGHVKVGGSDGLACYCGARDCATTYGSLMGMAQRYAAKRDGGRVDFLDVGTGETLYSELIAAYRQSDPLAIAVLREGGDLIGKLIANQINYSDPGRVVVLFQDPTLLEVLEPYIRLAVDRDTLPCLRTLAPIEMRLSDSGDIRRGCAALALEMIYSNTKIRRSESSTMSGPPKG